MNGILVAIALFLMTSVSIAREIQMPKSGGTPVYKTLIVETIYPFSLIEFKSPIDVQVLQERSRASYSSPEEALSAHFSAMIKGDFDWFKETWTTSAWVSMQEANKKNNRGSEFWLGMWRKSLAEKHFQLVNWINYGSYVLVEYQLVGKNGKTGSGIVALIKEQGDWRVTQDLAKDPIFLNWKNPLGRIQVPADSIFIR